MFPGVSREIPDGNWPKTPPTPVVLETGPEFGWLEFSFVWLCSSITNCGAKPTISLFQTLRTSAEPSALITHWECILMPFQPVLNLRFFSARVPVLCGSSIFSLCVPSACSLVFSHAFFKNLWGDLRAGLGLPGPRGGRRWTRLVAQSDFLKYSSNSGR